jgi:hypothetical protein
MRRLNPHHIDLRFMNLQQALVRGHLARRAFQRRKKMLKRWQGCASMYRPPKQWASNATRPSLPPVPPSHEKARKAKQM